MYETRTYRELFHSDDLLGFGVRVKETDLYVAVDVRKKKDVEDIITFTEKLVRECRQLIEDYIREFPIFEMSFKPVRVSPSAPGIIKEMAEAAWLANVGPFASVAGAIAGYVGRNLSRGISNVIVENGGDIFIKSTKVRRVGIYSRAGNAFRDLGLEILPKDTPLGICASSGVEGHSVSLGRADIVVAVSSSCTLADACATRIANVVQDTGDIEKGINLARSIPGIKGILIIKGDRLGVWGELRLTRI